MSLIQDPGSGTAAAVKPASTSPSATDPALVIAISPNSPPISATVTNGTFEITDGTHGPVAVKPASTAVAAGDLSLAVGLSPNSPLPAGTNAIGTVTAVSSTPANLQGEVGGLGTAGAATVGNPVLTAGTDGTNTRTILTDASGRSIAVGAAAAGAAVAGNPVLMAGSDGTNARTMATDTSGRPIFVGAGTAGTPVGGVVSVQGVAGGQAVPISGSVSVTGSATVAQGAPNTTANSWPMEITDGVHGPAAVKAASTAPVATDPALVVTISPNSPGVGSVAQGTAAALAGAWPMELTDGTHGPAAIKAASTAAVATDPALVVAVSPNNAVAITAAALPLPAGAATSANQTTLGTQTTELNDGTHTATIKAASTAAAAADTSLVVGLSPNSPLPAGTNAVGTVTAVGAAAGGAPVSGNPVLMGGSDGTDARTLATDASGRPVVVGPGTAGTPAGGVLSIQGVAGGTTIPVTAAQGAPNTLANSWPTQLTDGTHGPAAVKAASTAAVATDPALVVAVSPNNSVAITAAALPLPAGAATAANQTTLGSQTTEINDGTHTVTIAAASTAVVATQPALAVGLSPNSPLPAGTNTLGALTANQSVNVAQVGGTATVTGGVAGSLGVGGLAASGAALAGNPVLTAGSDGTDARTIATDTSGRHITVGAAAAGAAAAGNPVQVGGVFNTTSPAPATGNVEPLQFDQASNLLVFQGSQVVTGAAWNNGTAANTVQYQNGTATIGQLLGAPTVYVQLDMTTTLTGGAVTFEGTFDGTNWQTVPAGNVLNPQTYQQIANPYTFVASTQTPFLIILDGFIAIRARLSTAITGTGTVTLYWSSRSQAVTDLPVSEQTAYGSNNQALTITLTGLASAAQRGSVAVNNTATVYKDALVQVLVQSNAAGVSGTGVVNIYAYSSANGGTNYGDGVTGTDAVQTLTSPPNLKLIGQINVVALATVYTSTLMSVAAVFGGRLPQFWGIVVENKSGAALGATAADNKAYFQGVG